MAMLPISGVFSIPTAHSKLLYCISSASPFSTKRDGLQLQSSRMPESTFHFSSNKNTTTLMSAKAYEREPMTSTSPKVPKDRMCLPGCDYEHWLIVMDFPTEPKPSPDEMIDTYIKTLAKVVGSEEEAKKRIYAVSTTTYTGFQCFISEELSQKFDDLPGVLWVLPDSYLDVPNKDYGGDKFVDGKVIPRPQPPQSERQFRGNRRAQRPAKYDNRRFQPRSNAVQEQDA